MTEFDVFLSHNSKDKPAARRLARRLEARHIRVWLDEDQLIPGRSWQPLLEEAIEHSATGAVLVGKDGAGPWQDEEMQALLGQAVRKGKPVIPVLLPDAPNEPERPLFLRNRTWVDLRVGSSELGIDRLIWGITGKKPESLRADDESVQEATTTPAQLWPDPRMDPQSAGTTDCYHRLDALCARSEVPEPDERRALWQAVKRHRPSSFLAWQLANLARWSAPEYLEVDERFTPLRVHVRVRENDETPAERQELPFDTLIEAMAAVLEDHRAPASVIFAPPGGAGAHAARGPVPGCRVRPGALRGRGGAGRRDSLRPSADAGVLRRLGAGRALGCRGARRALAKRGSARIHAGPSGPGRRRGPARAAEHRLGGDRPDGREPVREARRLHPRPDPGQSGARRALRRPAGAGDLGATARRASEPADRAHARPPGGSARPHRRRQGPGRAGRSPPAGPSCAHRHQGAAARLRPHPRGRIHPRRRSRGRAGGTPRAEADPGGARAGRPSRHQRGVRGLPRGRRLPRGRLLARQGPGLAQRPDRPGGHAEASSSGSANDP